MKQLLILTSFLVLTSYVFCQSPLISLNDSNVVISGVISGSISDTLHTMPGANVWIKNYPEFYVTSDGFGRYKLEIAKHKRGVLDDTLSVSFIGFETLETPIRKAKLISTQEFKIVLKEIEVEDSLIAPLFSPSFKSIQLEELISNIAIELKGEQTLRKTDQEFQIIFKGTIKDQHGQSLPFANITLESSEKIGTSADISGNFELKVPFSEIKKDESLIFSFVGFEEKKIRINRDSLLNKSFHEQNIVLEDFFLACNHSCCIPHKPNILKRTWWGIKGLFRRK